MWPVFSRVVAGEKYRGHLLVLVDSLTGEKGCYEKNVL